MVLNICSGYLHMYVRTYICMNVFGTTTNVFDIVTGYCKA